MINIGNKIIQTTEDGFLKNFDDWNSHVAEFLAKSQGIQLSEEHWDVLKATRKFYFLYDMSPNQRPFVKHIAKELGKEKGTSRYLLKLFPGSPAKTASLIAGIPKPDHCF